MASLSGFPSPISVYLDLKPICYPFFGPTLSLTLYIYSVKKSLHSFHHMLSFYLVECSVADTKVPY